jgi:hypothetical protein
VGQWFVPLAARFPECFWLPGGGDSRRALLIADPDEYGEYPVFVLDVDDMPCMELLYPGFDVYLADTAGLVEHSYPRDEFESYSKLMKHPTYGARMATHARQILDGETHLTYPF